MGKVTVPLKSPIEAHGETIKELQLDEPDLGALDGVEIVVKGDGSVRINLGDLPKLVANMAGIPPSAAKKIKFGDVGAVGQAVMGFFPEFLRTGESSKRK